MGTWLAVQYGIDLHGASVLVTGGTGSFGQALTRHFLESDMPTRLLLLSRDELKQAEMSRWAQHPNLRFLLGDVRDRERLYRAFEGVDVVIHAAALKRVDALEYNPREGVLTNVVGAMNLMDAAIDRGVSKVLALSSDKATAPLNLYGATKMTMEKLLIAANAYSGSRQTAFACTRYGNVIGSRGSVVPLWQQHVATCSGSFPFGSPCTGIRITDPRMTRYWLSLDTAVEFVLASLERMKGGEVMIPRLPSVRLVDVAKAIAPDCKYEVVGVRMGEKLHESLAAQDELRKDMGEYLILGQGDMGTAISSDTNDTWLSVEEIRASLPC